MSARRYDPEGTRQAILAAAHEIFMARGVADAPMSEIAKASGVTKSLIHHHFGSKDELWRAVKEQAFEPFFSGLLEIIRADGPHLEALERTIRFMFGFFRARPDVARLMAWMRMEDGGEQACPDLEGEVVREGLARIAAAQQAGLIRQDLDPASIQLSFIILCTGWFQLRHVAEKFPLPEGVDAFEPQYLEQMMSLFMSGILPAPA